MRLLLALAFLVPCVAVADAVDAATATQVKKTAQVRGIRARYRVVAIEEADIDGDGSREVAVAFKPRKEGRKRGGFLVLVQRGGKYRTVWGGVFPASYPESMSVEKDTIKARMVTPSGKTSIALRHGVNFRFFSLKESPFKSPKVAVSSTLKAPRGTTISSANLTDGDPDTVWAEGAMGTGAAEWIQLEFAKPVNLGLLGVIGGDYRSQRHWEDSNRLHRFDVAAETPADRTTTVEDMDLTRELSLPSTGRRNGAKCKDIRRMKWVEVARKDTIAVKVEVTSVYLGEKNDDLFVSEIEFAELLPDPTD